MRFITNCVLVLSALSVLISPASSKVKVAVVYSSFNNFTYKDEMSSILNAPGWETDMYENIKIGELITKIDNYDLILLNAVYNYVNTQDFAFYAKQWRDYISNGGCVISTDSNYSPQADWLKSIDERLMWNVKGEPNPNANAPISSVESGHPLMSGVGAPPTPWTQPSSWSQALIPLVADKNGRPVVAYAEIGKGIVVVSSSYRQYGFPNKNFLLNLVTWVNDPMRLNSVLKKSLSAENVVVSIPELNIGSIKGAEINSFSGLYGDSPSEQTQCLIKADDDAIKVVFQCFDNDISNIKHLQTKRDAGLWTDDFVDVYLDPDGSGNQVYHFAVNSIGTRYDDLNNDSAWDAYWTSEIEIKSDMWEAKLNIPYAFINSAKTPNNMGIWHAAFVRRSPKESGAGSDISVWQPIPDRSDGRIGFGKIKGIKFDNAKYLFAPELSVSMPEKCVVGNNKINVGFVLTGDMPENARIECIDLSADNVLGMKKLSSDKKDTADIKANIPTDGYHELQMILRDDSRIYASSKVFKVDVSPILETQLIMPAFRNSIQSKDPQKMLRISGVISDRKANNFIARVTFTPKGKSTPVWQIVKKISANKFEIEKDLAGFPVGDYIAHVELEDSDKNITSWTAYDIHILPQSATEITFNEKNICYVNGKPFFPIGLYHVSPTVLDRLNAANEKAGLPKIDLDETMKQIKHQGFNTIHHSWVMADENYLQMAQDNGLFVIPEIGAPDENTLKSHVSVGNRFSNLLHWYGIDEPIGDKLETAISAYDMFKRIDPHRPVSAALCNPDVFMGAMSAYDMLIMDPYFIRFAPLTKISEWFNIAYKATKGRKPIWVVPQAFTISNSTWSEPTNDELRCQAYLSLVHGATGIIWYALWTSEPYYENPKGRDQWYLPDSHLWEYFPKLNSEIETFAPVIINGDSMGEVKCDNESIRSNMWQYGNTRYIIAINPTDKEIDCELEISSKSAIDVMFEKRKITPSDNKIRDKFKPLEAHVYKFTVR